MFFGTSKALAEEYGVFEVPYMCNFKFTSFGDVILSRENTIK